MAATIDPATAVGPVSLTVRDLERVREFYERVVGLRTLSTDGSSALLGAGERPLVELVADPGAQPRPPRTSGLFHLAILVPDRVELARSLWRIVAGRWPLAGASDHLVSEALYLGDPEGNGIEIYRDRPRQDWKHDAGELQMATLPLDVDGLVAELGESERATVAGSALTEARMGHVHLNVADLDTAERFYADLLGLDVTARGYPGALFMAAGGYHHHVGVNVWRGEGVPAPLVGSAGLRTFELTLPDGDALAATVGRLRKGGAEVAQDADGTVATTRDPSGNGIALRAAS